MRAALTLAETRLEHATVRTPVAASVLTRSIEVGDTVQAGQSLFILAPQAATELTAHIDEKNLAFLALGQQALASADAYPELHFPARLSYIAPSVDPLRGSVEIRLEVSEPPPYLRHEMTVSIDIETARQEAALSLPLEAVVDAAGRQPWAMVVRDGHTVRQNITPGLRSNAQLAVSDGLQAGEIVVLKPGDLAPGARVSIRERH